MNIRRFIVEKIIRPKYVAFTTDDGVELGVEIFGVIVGYYKSEPLYYDRNSVSDIRLPEKREFGESIHPVGYYN